MVELGRQMRHELFSKVWHCFTVKDDSEDVVDVLIVALVAMARDHGDEQLDDIVEMITECWTFADNYEGHRQ